MSTVHFRKGNQKASEPGPIGLKLTEVLAQIFIWWDSEFANRLEKMNERYVDDINMAVQATKPGQGRQDFHR